MKEDLNLLVNFYFLISIFQETMTIVILKEKIWNSNQLFFHCKFIRRWMGSTWWSSEWFNISNKSYNWRHYFFKWSLFHKKIYISTSIFFIILLSFKGHKYLKRRFGITPKVAWQIDPFGHSSLSPGIFSQMGYKCNLIFLSSSFFSH